MTITIQLGTSWLLIAQIIHERKQQPSMGWIKKPALRLISEEPAFILLI